MKVNLLVSLVLLSIIKLDFNLKLKYVDRLLGFIRNVDLLHSIQKSLHSISMPISIVSYFKGGMMIFKRTTVLEITNCSFVSRFFSVTWTLRNKRSFSQIFKPFPPINTHPISNIFSRIGLTSFNIQFGPTSLSRITD